MENRSKASHLLLHLWFHLYPRRRRQCIIAVLLMLFSALTELVSLGAVLPFIGVLTAPEQIYNHPFISPIAQYFQINSAEELVLPLTLIFITLALAAGILRTFLLWVSSRLAGAIGTDLSYEVYNRTLYQPYNIHLQRNSSEIISGITGKVNSVVSMVLLPVFILISSSFLLLGVGFTLISLDPVIALGVSLGLGGVYLILILVVRRRLVVNSRLIAQEQTNVVKALQEGLGGIRDVLLDGLQQVYSEIYRRADYPLRRAQANNVFVVGSPRFAMEAIGIIALVAVAYFVSLKPEGINSALPMLGLLAFAAQRLLPALQQLYSAWSTISGNHESLREVIELLDQPIPSPTSQVSKSVLKFEKYIRLDNVSFRFSDDGLDILSGVSLRIPRGASVGIVGTTGSGKSTLLDLLMGLLQPTDGMIYVDDNRISTDNLRLWQNNIAHVPQTIFLTDASIAENIAFGIPKERIDMERVKSCARLAQIDRLVMECERGFQTFVGERGTKLSGGQRQRIGIARALYKRANILIFDEATSALDNSTEQKVIKAMTELDAGLTTFFIAHRLTTIKDCDIIIELEGGKVIAQGTYSELLNKSSTFKRMHLNIQ